MSKYYHLVGIGGIGVGTLASLFLDEGHSVSGSDIKENDMTKALKEKGVRIFIGHKESNIVNPDCVVCSSAISQDNPEIVEAKRKNIPIVKRGQALADLVRTKNASVIAGAHGKTTTSALVAHILSEEGLDPTAAIGGIIKNGGYSGLSGKGEHFVIEADESDGSFLYFFPKYAIITNVDLEHVDFYQNWDNIINAYEKFIMQIDLDGHFFYFGDDPVLSNLAFEFKGRKSSYGFDQGNDIFADKIRCSGFQSNFSCIVNGKKQGEVKLNIPGRHNICNALAAIGLALEFGICFASIQKSLESFKGVQRRFSYHGDFNDIFIVDDYAHHPKEIFSTLAAAKTFEKKRIFVIFQPHRYSRTKYFKDDFVDVLKECDQLVITDIYSASEKDQQQITPDMICEDVNRIKPDLAIYKKYDEIISYVLKNVLPGDLVLFLGAGDINRLAGQLVDQLNKNK
ncbi:MAG: UDP-N-acetylmuramate--L-alanine ligase [Candidatus Omnitrophica bacterium]|nr:UDP-N-acetylmuramate--L-alanine ligase [Candidatus Omnitrophota bacterium]